MHPLNKLAEMQLLNDIVNQIPSFHGERDLVKCMDLVMNQDNKICRE